MAARRPLVALSGLPAELPSGDTISVGSPGALTLGTGWTNFGSGYQTAIYGKSIDSKVELGGMVTGNGTTFTIATLPAGYRPVAKRAFPVANATVVGYVSIDTTGVISLDVGNNTTYVSLDGIFFYV